jgi:apolipoprotein N-acyltransferase
VPIIFAALFSSVLYVFSFAPWSTFTPALSLLQWFAFVPIFYSLANSKLNYKKTFLIGYIISLGITVGGFYWIIYATQQYGGLPFAAAFCVFLLFCLIAQLPVPLYLIFRKKALEHLSIEKWILFSGLLYAGIESFYPKLFLDTAGHAFADSVYFSQLADIGGVFFITTLVITFSESLAYSIRQKGKLIWLPMVIISSSFGYGYFRVNQIDQLIQAQKQTPSLKVAMVQANIGDYMKIAAERGLSGASDQVIQEYLKYSSAALSNSPDAIVWPETAYSALFGKPLRLDEKRMEEQLREFSSRYSGMMIFGGYDQDDERYDYNSLFFLPSSEALTYARVPTYHKNILLMFGETLPFSDFFPSMKNWFPTMGFFGRGPGPEVYPVSNAQGNIFKLAPSICYEGLFPSFSSKGALLGADALINVTNDSWFGPDGEPYLHFALTRFRTIETRLPMLRSTNTGITAMIDPLGRLEGKTNLFEAAVLQTEVHPHLGITSPFQKIASVLSGEWYERFTQLITFGLLAFLWTKRKK